MELCFRLEEIREAAEKFLAITAKYKVLAVNGEMGAGKTTFIHALCEAMGVNGHLSSPTFSIINQYTTSDEQIIYHMDLFRLKNEQEAIDAGVEECLFSGNTCFIEWPEKAPHIFPDNTLYIFIKVVDTNIRKLLIEI